jgi:hypothetical protein
MTRVGQDARKHRLVRQDSRKGVREILSDKEHQGTSKGSNRLKYMIGVRVTRHQAFRYSAQVPASSLGGLQSNKSKASVLQGPTSLSVTGLTIGESVSEAGAMLLSIVKLFVLASCRRGSVFLMSAASPDFFLAATAGVSSAVIVAFGAGFGRFLFSHSSLVLGIGASFSLRTRLNLRLGDIPAASASSSMGSAVAFGFLLGCCNLAASSVVVITGPFLLARSGCGGSATVWWRGAADCIGRCIFGGGVAVFVFLRNPPVDNAASLRGDRDPVRDLDSEIALKAGDATLFRESSAAMVATTLGDTSPDLCTSCTRPRFSLTPVTTGMEGDTDRGFFDRGTVILWC